MSDDEAAGTFMVSDHPGIRKRAGEVPVSGEQASDSQM
jgi:hypothetical protein